MASSSSKVVLQKKWEVFLSFRGEDTRNKFTSHLYAALCNKQISTFFDEDGLKRGENISSLFKAIENSRISIIIFSKDYASSKWCLNELVKILECKKTNNQEVIPVFYEVSPSEVRHQTGDIGAAFDEHEKRSEEDVQRWRAALTEASVLSGCESKLIRRESELVDKIVSYVLEKLQKDPSCPGYVKGLFGMEEPFERIKSLLREYQILGIWGMGGIGKTTIAKSVFKQIYPKFEGHCFIENVREEFEKQPPCLRQQFLSAILEEKIEIFHIRNPFIENRVQRKKVLIVFDDVSDFEELDYLIEGLQFSSESKFIITTRNKQILSSLEGKTSVYEVKELDNKHAFELFSYHAFKQNPPTDKDILDRDLVELSEKIVGYVTGHPLALKVLGSHLCGKEKTVWESALGALGKRLRPIHDILAISYNGLDDDQKNIFLDIACFFKRFDFERVKKILNSCYESVDYNLDVLIDKALITKIDDPLFIGMARKFIEMHDLLQELGGDIELTKELKNRSRLWNHEHAFQLLKNDMEFEAVRGLFLDLSKTTEAYLLSPEAFNKMPNLKFLSFYAAKQEISIYEKGDPYFEDVVNISSVDLFNSKLKKLKYLSNELRYLYWYGCPLQELPSTFSLENLVELALPKSKVRKLWHGRKNLSKLISLDLHDSESLLELPDLSNAVNLEVINLKNCKSLVSLYPSNLPIEYLPKCIVSALESWGSVKSIPTLGKLKSLKQLNLSHCPNLLNIPEDLCCIPSLEVLDLSRNNFGSLPLNLKQLLRLKKLDLHRCYMLQSLPDLPPNLYWLDAHDCKQLQSIGRLLPNQEEVDALGFHFFYIGIIDCERLAENTTKKFLAEAKLYFQHSVTLAAGYDKFEETDPRSLFLTGSEIPDWIIYQSEGSSLTIDLSQDRSNEAIIGFICCAVVKGPGGYSSFHLSVGSNGQSRCSWIVALAKPFKGVHVWLTYFLDKGNKETGGDVTTIEFEIFGHGGPFAEIKRCGACPVYLDSKEAQHNNFSKNFATANKLDPSRSGIFIFFLLTSRNIYIFFVINPLYILNNTIIEYFDYFLI